MFLSNLKEKVQVIEFDLIQPGIEINIFFYLLRSLSKNLNNSNEITEYRFFLNLYKLFKAMKVMKNGNKK